MPLGGLKLTLSNPLKSFLLLDWLNLPVHAFYRVAWRSPILPGYIVGSHNLEVECMQKGPHVKAVCSMVIMGPLRYGT